MFVHCLATRAGYRKAQEKNNNFVSREGLESRVLYRVWAMFWTVNSKHDVERGQISIGIRYHMFFGRYDFWQIRGFCLIYLKG